MDTRMITALYERISRDDDLEGESNSISNQKRQLEDYARSQGFPNAVHFTDDGISGTCFDRPGFLAMMKEVEAGRVEYLLIKDMSRLGRDYLKVGQIMEILRQKGVRLIAINDGVDSARGDDDFTPFRNIMNEYYARDTSRKIRSTFQSKGKSGEHVTGLVIYGYLWNEARDQWAWYGLCRFEKAIPKALNPMYGFRLRQGNIQIGDNTAVASLFKEDRGNSYFIGEIFTVDKNLIPNSQRNYFNETPARINLEEQLRVFFYDELHRLYHVANETKNHYKKLEAYNDAVAKLQEKHAKGFVDKKEQSRMEATVEDARKKKDAAKKKLEKTVETLTTSGTLTPEQRVQKEIQYKFEKKNVSSATQKAEKKETEIVEQKEEKKSKYFTDNLSKLDKSKRKLVGQIMGIVSQIAPENIAEEIQAAIEKEFR